MKADELFAAALEIADPTERAAFLNHACAGCGELRSEVESLLAAHEQAGAFLELSIGPGAQSAFSAAASPDAEATRRAADESVRAPSQRAGDCIGRYKLLEKIGTGGFGDVWMAEQEEPVRRRVALKIIKLGMDTRDVVARFEAERQALALMDHPNIAKVHDGGATETGRPYFVMELVRGVRITDYCDANNLPTVERLKLFMQVCQAVQHAHQKGIIHRDLKPSNILVTVNDGAPVPKVIDFGIAKATEQRLTDKTVFTRFMQFLGTPAYMSPEQAELTSLDIDTRSDIYSLGVLLYELLTGRTPFDAKDLLEAGLDEMRRTIRETEPMRPSTRLSTLQAADQTEVARRRQAEPPRLIKLLRGDLDWIVMKALEKDRTRRFETPSALSHDLERYLKNQPVSAVAPTFSYRASKFFRRHKSTVIRTASSFLIGGFVVTTLFWLLTGRGPAWLSNILPNSRVVNTPPHLSFERAMSDVYVPDASVTAPGNRMLRIGSRLFVQLHVGEGGWNMLDLHSRRVRELHAQCLAYVADENGRDAYELVLARSGLQCARMGSSAAVTVLPSPADPQALTKVITTARVYGGLIGCAVPEANIVFAFDVETGQVVWKALAAENAPVNDLRVGYVATDGEVFVAGSWGSRVAVFNLKTGQRLWQWKEGRYGNALNIIMANERVFAFSASGNAYAFESRTGQQLWSKPVGRGDEDGKVANQGTNILVLPGDGRIVAIAQADGHEVWRSKLMDDHWSRYVAVSSELLVVAAGNCLQRFDPFTGTPGAYLELPTLKKTVSLFGEETSVFVSHPVVVTPLDTVYAFTVDGSLWCAQLPAISSNLTHASRYGSPRP